MLRPEPLDLVIIAVIAMLIFGANRIPESAHAIGQAIREFKQALAGKNNSDSPKTKPD